jgi:hypothetical protein
MSISLFTLCPHCGRSLVLSDGHDAFLVHCEHCLDPDGEQEHERLQGRGELPEVALNDFLEKAEERGITATPVPSTLADYVVPFHEGYALTSGDPHNQLFRPYRNLREAEVLHIASPHPIVYGPVPVQKAANQ